MRVYLLFALIVLAGSLQAQPAKPIKFGKVSVEDFDVKSELIDSSANAVIISDVGHTEFRADPNNKSFKLEFKREKRVKILNQKGFDVATMIIALYRDGESTEKLDKVRAYTYNLENGKVVRTALENSSIFSENINRKLVYKKFTLPAVKEGSIIEISYVISSDFLFNLQPWTFQSQHPCLWSEYTCEIPEFYTYIPLFQGYQQFAVNSRDQRQVKYTFREEARVEPGVLGGRYAAENFDLEGALHQFKWAMKEIPAIREESFTTTVDNHIAKIEFQLMQIKYPNSAPRQYMSDWTKVNSDLLESDHFGRTYQRANNWLDDDIKPIIGKATGKLEVAEKIYNYIRNNFTVTRYSYMSGETNLKEVFGKKSGSVAEVNLLLIAMLRHEGIQAHPVILSTRGNGIIHPAYPLMDRFNYLIAYFNLDSADYFVDASEPMLGFGKLPLRCYNGSARLITSQPLEVSIDPGSLRETSTSMFILMNEEQGGLKGTVSSTRGYFESLGMRQALAKSGKDPLLKSIAEKHGEGFTVENVTIDSLDQYDVPVKISYDMTWKPEDDILYLNPMFGEAITNNPFKTAKREYPVEMPYTFEKTIIVNMEVPNGYVVDELPKSTRVKLNEDEGMFEYLIGATGTNIQLRTKVTVNKAMFEKEDYETLRDFYTYIIKKQSEQVVLKKKQ